MLKNYLLIAWRNLLKNKIYSGISISGLAVGLAVSMLILLYVFHELSYDKFHKNADRIYHSLVKLKFGANEVLFNQVSKNFAHAVKSVSPEIEATVRIGSPSGDVVVKSDEDHKFFEPKFYYSEPSLFDVFSLKLIQGDKGSSLQEPNTILINANVAKKYFGEQDPIGKSLTINKNDVLKVTGIFEPLPSNSTLQFDFIASLPTFDQMMKRDRPQFYESDDLVGTGIYQTYFLVNRPDAIAKISERIPALLTVQEGDNLRDHAKFLFEPFNLMHLGNNWSDFSNTKYISIFLFIAAIVLLLALINYMSLTTARASTRVKEVGVRKVLGAARQNLAGQFFGESIITSLISFALALMLFQVLRQPFLNLLDLKINSDFITSPLFITILATLFLLTALVSGIYPALVLSSFSPMQVLKGYFFQGKRDVNIRRGFIVFQFMTSVALIICSMVVNNQLHFLQNQKIGLNKEQVLVLPLSKEAQKHFSSLRTDLNQLTGIKMVGSSSYAMYKGGWNMFFTKTPTTQEDVSVNYMDVDENFLKILELDWKIKPDDMNSLTVGDDKILINETAVNKLKIENDPINQTLNVSGQNRKIAGVVNDFNFTSLQQKIDAMSLIVVKDTTKLRTLYLRMDPNSNFNEKLASIEKTYKKYESDVPFNFYFLDDAFNNLYRSEERMKSLFSGFTGVAIFIACIGLLGLITFTAETKTKEIGIRKVLGAGVSDLIGLMSKDLIWLILIANVLAFPLAYYWMNKWLQGFAYQTDMNWFVFAKAGSTAFILAILTISFQTFKTAWSNPIKSIRNYE